MTCSFALSLLSDYIDNELVATDAEQLRNHLNTCPDCRAEFENSVRLKELLGWMPDPDPGPRYWEDLAPVIIARTVQSAHELLTRTAAGNSSFELRRSFTRALITCAMSLTLLFSAVMIGRHYRPIQSETVAAREPLLMAASLHNCLGSDRKAIITAAEEQNINLATLLVGPPNSIGRFTALYALSAPRPLHKP